MTYDDSAREVELELRERAIKQLKKRRDFRGHLMIYVLVNTFLVVIWAVTTGGDGFFWPVFVLGGWAIGLVANFYDVYIADDISEAEIRRQMDVLSRR